MAPFPTYAPETHMLINEIQKYQLIYNFKHKDYKDRRKRLAVWTAISISLDMTVEDCRDRWRHVRDRFVKEVKKAVKSSGSTASSTIGWHLYESLKFLLPFFQTKRPIINYLEDKEVLDSYQDSSLSTSYEGSPERKETINIETQNVEVPYNDYVPVTSTKGASKKRKRSEAEDDAFPELTHACYQTKDKSQHIGDYVAAQLRSFDEFKRVRATKRVIEVILEEELL